MPEILFYTRSVFFTSIFVFIFTVLSFGQSVNLKSDLSQSFKKFDLIKLNQQKAFQQVENSQTLSIPTAEGKIELNLIPNDLRAAGYQAEDTAENGIQKLDKGEVTTFKGKVTGKTDSDVRLTINGGTIEGYVEFNGEKLFIEPARNFSQFAGSDDLVVYHENDLVKGKGFTCDSEITQKIERGKEMVTSQATENTQSFKVIELATEADFQFVTALGGANQANNEILSTLNMVEGIFEKELNLSISVTYQHTWSIADSFDGTSANTLIVSLKDYWNANFPQSQHPRSTTHLFTGKPNVSDLGLAYIGVVCANPNFAYGLGGRTFSKSVSSLVTAHEIGHTLGAHHVDATQSCANSTMNAVVSEATPATFCSFSRNEVANYITAGAVCLMTKTVSANSRAKFDFDGDGRADVAVWRPSNGIWYINNSSNSSFNFVQFGAAGDRVVPADYDDDGKTDIAVYRAGAWFMLKSAANTFYSGSFGNSTDIPVPADYDGDGKADVAVFRPSDGVWHRLLSGSNNAYSSSQFGSSGDVPLPADFDGDGRADVNVWRPSNGNWYRIVSSNNSFYSAQFGAVGDKPLVGDFDGDGKADPTIWRPSNGVWYQVSSSNGAFSSTNFGTAGDVPTPADYDGDGKTDISVFRPGNGYWYRLNSSTGAFAFSQFGSAGDMPIPLFY